MKLNLGLLVFVLLLTAYATSEKLLRSMEQDEQGDDQGNGNDSSATDMPGAIMDRDGNNENIVSKLKELPTDKLKNILKIINRQKEEETESSSKGSESSNEDNNPDDYGNGRKVSFHNIVRKPETLLTGQSSENMESMTEQDPDEDTLKNSLKSSKEMTKTGNLRRLKKLEPVTNVLIHAFEGDLDEGVAIGTKLRSASRTEDIVEQPNGREMESGSNDVFAGIDDKSIPGKASLLGVPGSRMKLARLVPRFQKIDGTADDTRKEQYSRRKEGAVDSESVQSHGGLQQDDSSHSALHDVSYLKPIKLRPLLSQRAPYRKVISEKLPDKIIEEISQAMIDRVNDSGDRKTALLGKDSLSDRAGDSSAGRAQNTLDANLANATTGAADKRASPKSQFAFSYDPDSPIGPEMWKVLHTDWTCQGRKQSPINIKTENVANDTTCKNIVVRVEPEGRPITGILRNNGHAPTFSLTSGATVRLMGATLPNDYFLKQLHFHFGCENSRGSEHKIDDQSFPMELHLVFWDKKTFESFAQAAKSDRGIAVVAVLFQRSFVPASQARNTPVTQLLQVLKKIPNEGDFVQISDIFDFRLERLIPNVMNAVQSDRFFTYEGSLTTPGCYESVIWIVFNSHPIITDDQLEMFRKLKSAKVNADGTMCDNFRPIQKSYGRRIYSNII